MKRRDDESIRKVCTTSLQVTQTIQQNMLGHNRWLQVLPISSSRAYRLIVTLAGCSFLAACALTPHELEPARHLTTKEATPAPAEIPEVIPVIPKPPRPQAHATKTQRFSIVVRDVPVRD